MPSSIRTDSSNSSSSSSFGSPDVTHSDSTIGSPQPSSGSEFSPSCDIESQINSTSLVRGIYAYGFEEFTPQQARIVAAIGNTGPKNRGKHIVVDNMSCAEGKTTGMVIGVLHRLIHTVADFSHVKCPRVLIITPSRELATHVGNVCSELGEFLRFPLDPTPGEMQVVHTLIGGESVASDIRALNERGAGVIVGTAGRVIDMISRANLMTNFVDTVVLDDADDLLNSPKKAESIHELFQLLPAKTRMVFVSTLLSRTSKKEIEHYCDLRKVISIDGGRALPLPTSKSGKADLSTLEDRQPASLPLQLHHRIVQLHEPTTSPIETLGDLLEMSQGTCQTVVFCESARRVDWVVSTLQKNYPAMPPVSYLHSELAQHDRSLVIREFQSGTARLLITTPEMLRGLSVHFLWLVIFFDVPTCAESYARDASRAFARNAVIPTFKGPTEAFSSTELTPTVKFPSSLPGGMVITLSTCPKREQVFRFQIEIALGIGPNDVTELEQDFVSCLPGRQKKGKGF